MNLGYARGSMYSQQLDLLEDYPVDELFSDGSEEALDLFSPGIWGRRGLSGRGLVGGVVARLSRLVGLSGRAGTIGDGARGIDAPTTEYR